MKKNLRFVIAAAFAVLLFFGCKKSTIENIVSNVLDINETQLVQNAGLNPNGAIKVEGKYLIEGDLLLSADELSNMSGNNGPKLIVANSEQYRTTNLVTGLPRNINVSYTGSNTSLSNAVDAAIARYNAQNLLLHFYRVTSGADINVTTVKNANYIASSGFPTGGNPYGSVVYNLRYINIGTNTVTSVMAHELGHCIGFRHTDYMDRSYSCGGSYSNEGASTVGAIWISGTPTGPDADSWMLACIGSGVDRPFNANDRTALSYLY